MSKEFRIEQRHGDAWHPTAIVYTCEEDAASAVTRYRHDYPGREYRIMSREVGDWATISVAA